MAGLTVFQSWFQGAILHGRQTRAIPEATAIFLSVFLLVALVGISTARFTGIYVGMTGFVAANLAQAGWLWWRSRKILRAISLK
jgi:hypothetical protein